MAVHIRYVNHINDNNEELICWRNEWPVLGFMLETFVYCLSLLEFCNFKEEIINNFCLATGTANTTR